MDTTALKKFAQGARRQLLEQVSARMEQVLRSDSVEIREKAKVVAELKAQIEKNGKAVVIDRVAYTWFNRFCALRFMDVNHYTRIGAVSPVEGGTQPEVLLEAKQGHVDEELARFVNSQGIISLLNGQRPASDPQGEAYRLLLVGVCNSYSNIMPFMFEKIEDYTELLMPLDLLSENSVLHDLRQALTPEACQDVEVIGWLYQYYISERKDKVFEALKQNQKIEAGDIPAATQLFTPHWIARYLVENSLGRLWMLNYPNSRLIEKMAYYIAPAQVETDFLHIASPEELRLLDPACGSGHILTYAFDLFYAIYEEEGYAPSDIPRLILEKNLFGIEIDPRAGALAAFALVMKARAKDKRFFTRTSTRGEPVEPNICVLENVTFNDTELRQYMAAVGRDLFTKPLMETLRQFEQADNFGSLIRPMLTDAGYVRGLLETKNLGGDLFLFGVHARVLKVLKQAEFLAPHYHVVVANPPYMGGGGMNTILKDFAKSDFPDTKSDVFAMFIERGFEFINQLGYNAMVTMQSWMFLKSFEELREKLLKTVTINCLVHMETMVMGIAFGTSATIWQKKANQNFKGDFSYVKYDELTEEKIPFEFPVKNYRLTRASANDFKKIPGYPVAYWIKDDTRKAFDYPSMSEFFESGGRCKTHNDELYLRQVWEFDRKKLGVNNQWCILYKGGAFQKHYGNRDIAIRWSEDAKNYYKSMGGLTDPKFWREQGITWTIVTSKSTSAFRLKDNDGQYSSVSPTLFLLPEAKNSVYEFLGLLNSVTANHLLGVLNPTLALNVGDVMNFPVSPKIKWGVLEKNTKKLLEIAREDWLSQETSWGFTVIPLLHNIKSEKRIEAKYSQLVAEWKNALKIYQELEKENNEVSIDAYDLHEELKPDVTIEDITLTSSVTS